MANDMSMSMFGDRLQMWNVGGGAIDTQSLVEMELAMAQLKNVPIQNQKKFAEQEKSYWQDLKATFTNFQSAVEKLKKLSDANKNISFSQEGYVTATAAKGALETSYKLEVQSIATAHKVLGDSIGDPTVALGKEGTVKINNEELEITADMSLNDIATKINEAKKMNGTTKTNENLYGVSASIINGTLVLTGKKTGEANSISFEDSSPTGGVLQELGLLTSNGAIKNEVQKANNAKFTVDGVEVTSASNSVSDAVSGVTFNLVKETTGPVTFTVNQNKDTLKTSISEFVSMYNKTVLRINQHTQKGAILQGKSIVNQSKSELNRAISAPTDSSLRMYEIGIQLDGIAKDGTLRFEESKLTKQLEDNFDEVFKMISGENGIANNLFKKVDALVKDEGSISTKIDGLDRSIKGFDDTLARNDAAFVRQRDMILNKYAKYEAMMSKLNFQGLFMQAQLDALNGNNNK